MRKKSDTIERVIPFSELQTGDIFKFDGKKKVFEVSKRNKADIDYFPHDDVWGDFRNTKKTSKRKVLINFEY